MDIRSLVLDDIRQAVLSGEIERDASRFKDIKSAEKYLLGEVIYSLEKIIGKLKEDYEHD